MSLFITIYVNVKWYIADKKPHGKVLDCVYGNIIVEALL